MTVIMPASGVCAVCGENSGQSYLKSSNGTGDFDLDFRRHGMIRSTINEWISRCPHCGYCAPNIGGQLKTTKKIVMSNEYQRQLIDTRFPIKANEFMCASMVYEYAGSYSKAAQHSIYAAWICDDNNLIKRSIELREKAIELIHEGKMNNQPLRCCPHGGEEILLIDLLRRAGRFDEVKNRCDSATENEISVYPKCKNVSEISENLKTQLMRFEKELVERKDTSRYSYYECKEKRRIYNEQNIITRIIIGTE